MSETEFAKIHLRDHLAGLVVSPVSEGFWSIYSSAKELCDRNNQPDQILRTFQNMLTKIPEWSDQTIGTEVERILKISKCNYMDDLLMGVFISYMKSFASLHYKGKSSELKVEFDRPNVSKFIHELYMHSARKIWKTAFLFKTVGVSSEQQAKNRDDIEKTINSCIESVINAFLPWENITKNYFADGGSQTGHVDAPSSKGVIFEDSSDDSDSDEEEELPKLTLSEETLDNFEVQTIDDEKKDEEMDPLKEIESKMQDSLVLNL